MRAFEKGAIDFVEPSGGPGQSAGGRGGCCYRSCAKRGVGSMSRRRRTISGDSSRRRPSTGGPVPSFCAVFRAFSRVFFFFFFFNFFFFRPEGEPNAR